MRPTILGLAVLLALLCAVPTFAADRAGDAGTSLVDAATVVAGPMAMTPTVAPMDVDRLVSAFGARDWHVVVAVMLGLFGYVLRRFSHDESWLQTPLGATVISMVLAAIGAVTPLLSEHASWRACAVTALVAGVTALAAMARPDGRPTYKKMVDGVLRPDYENGAKYLAGPIVVTLLASALLCGLAVSGCATFGEQPVALQRAERDAFACAAPVAQAAIQRFTPVAMDALAGEDVAWRAALADVEAAGASAIVCTVAHLLYDALGIDGVKAVAERDLERAVERELLIADSGGALVESPHRRVLRRGLEVLRDYRQQRSAAGVL